MALGKLWRFMKRYDEEPKVEPRDEKLSLEKGDLPAMILAAFLVFLPAALLILAIVVGLPVLFFLR